MIKTWQESQYQVRHAYNVTAFSNKQHKVRRQQVKEVDRKAKYNDFICMAFWKMQIVRAETNPQQVKVRSREGTSYKTRTLFKLHSNKCYHVQVILP